MECQGCRADLLRKVVATCRTSEECDVYRLRIIKNLALLLGVQCSKGAFHVEERESKQLAIPI
jgi:hypothetical protein